MSGQPAVLQVVILRDGLLVGTQVFVPGSYVLGSAPTADLQLDDPTVDPEHALLYFQNGKAAVQDSGSSTGLFVNGHQVTACEIRAVDEVVVGPFVLKTRALAQRQSGPKHAPPEVAALLQDQQRAQAQDSGPRLGQAIPPQGARVAPGPQVRVQTRQPASQPPAPAAAQARGAGQGQGQGQGRPTAPAARPPGLVNGVPMDATMPSARRRNQQSVGPDDLSLLDLPTAPGAVNGHGVNGHGVNGHKVTAGVQGGYATNPTSGLVVPTVPDAFAWPEESTQLASDEEDETATAVHNSLEPSGSAEWEAPVANTQPVGRRVTSPETPAVSAPPAKQRAGSNPPRPQQPVQRAKPSYPPGTRLDRLGNVVKKAAWPAPAPSEPQLFRIPKKGGRGAARLYYELYWKETRQGIGSFGPDKKKPVVAGNGPEAPLPLYGFSLPEAGFALAESTEKNTFRVFVPARAQVERRRSDGAWAPVQSSGLENSGGRRCVTLPLGASVKLVEGDMRLFCYVAPRPERVFVNPLKGLPWLAMLLVAAFSYGFGYFLVNGPKAAELPDFAAKSLNPVAIKLMAPEKKKEEPKKPEPKEEPKKEVVKEKPVPVKKVAVARPQPKPTPQPATPPPPENKALKALAKLSAAGPAMKDMLAAVDKLGSGPGNKNIKATNFKLANMIGKAPIANAGLGSFGLGGLGKGGGSTLGSELLHGRGGGGIGALGAGNVGKGHVGGTVSAASARQVAAQGSIDREAVAKAINSHLQEVRSCYERALLKNPGLAGKVVLEWTISTAGKVTTIKTKSSSLRDGSVEGCILQSLKSWQFPPAKGGLVIVSYPFLFNSVGY